MKDPFCQVARLAMSIITSGITPSYIRVIHPGYPELYLLTAVAGSRKRVDDATDFVRIRYSIYRLDTMEKVRVRNSVDLELGVDEEFPSPKTILDSAMPDGYFTEEGVTAALAKWFADNTTSLKAINKAVEDVVGQRGMRYVKSAVATTGQLGVTHLSRDLGRPAVPYVVHQAEGARTAAIDALRAEFMAEPCPLLTSLTIIKTLGADTHAADMGIVASPRGVQAVLKAEFDSNPAWFVEHWRSPAITACPFIAQALGVYQDLECRVAGLNRSATLLHFATMAVPVDWGTIDLRTQYAFTAQVLAAQAVFAACGTLHHDIHHENVMQCHLGGVEGGAYHFDVATADGTISLPLGNTCAQVIDWSDLQIAKGPISFDESFPSWALHFLPEKCAAAAEVAKAATLNEAFAMCAANLGPVHDGSICVWTLDKRA